MKRIGQFEVNESEYNAIFYYMKQGEKIKAMRKLQEIVGKEYGLFELKEAVETIHIPKIKSQY